MAYIYTDRIDELSSAQFTAEAIEIHARVIEGVK
jgi:hypothetical protein